MKLFLILAIICLIIYVIISRKKPQKIQVKRHLTSFSGDISLLVKEAIDLSAQNTAMPIQIFQVAGKLAAHNNKDEVISAIDYIYNTDSTQFGFGRRVSLTTLRFIGASEHSTAAQNAIEYLVLRGLGDEAIWVRYDAVWVAAILKIQNTDILSKLREMQAVLNNKEIKLESAEDKLRNRVNESLENL